MELETFPAGFLSQSVSDVTRYLRNLLDVDEILQDIWVRGEISNLAQPSSGHVYFTLKDPGASIKCVIWKSSVPKIKTKLENGMNIEARGRISIYDAGGQYQLYIIDARALGEGAYFQEFLRLKKMFELEGLFSPERKLPIPEKIHSVGVITSLKSAALQDVLTTIRRRNPMVEVYLGNTSVQGVNAPQDIISAINKMQQLVAPDVVILCRGGGSIEDLWAFNDEQLVRAIAACEIPIVTGIGHEVDFSLSDFAADVRAATPTGAAELVTPVTVNDMREEINSLTKRIPQQSMNFLTEIRQDFSLINSRLTHQTPSRKVENNWIMLDDTWRRFASGVEHAISMKNLTIAGISARLENLNPHNVLRRGYAIVSKASTKEVVSRIGQVGHGEHLNIRVQDGSISTIVSNTIREQTNG